MEQCGVHWFAKSHEYLCQLPSNAGEWKTSSSSRGKKKEEKLEGTKIWRGTDRIDQSAGDGKTVVTTTARLVLRLDVGRFSEIYAENTSIDRREDTRAQRRRPIRLCETDMRHVDTRSTHVPANRLWYSMFVQLRATRFGPDAHRIKVHYDNHIRYYDAGHIPY